ncbi:MAG: hypothetical protein QXS63_01080 [Zestosphaera sp.]
MGYLESLASKLNYCHFEINTIDSYYYFGKEITTTVISEWNAYLGGILKIEIQITDEFPEWEQIMLDWSNIAIGNSEEMAPFCVMSFRFLDIIGHKYIKGSNWTIYLVFPRLNFIQGISGEGPEL